MNGYPAGLSLESRRGAFSVSVDRATAVTEAFDVLWIAVKATQLHGALDSVSNADEIGAIVPLLNGIDHVALLRSRFGHERVIPATIAVESERLSPGRIVQRSPHPPLLRVSSMGAARLASSIQKLQWFGFDCSFIEDEPTLLWSKLVFLAPYALTTTASGMSAGLVAGDRTWRRRLESCVLEACAVGAASGAKLDPALVLRWFDGLPAGARSSMQKDVAAGNAPELDAIAGPVVRGAQQRGFTTPVTQELVELIRAKTRTGPAS